MKRYIDTVALFLLLVTLFPGVSLAKTKAKSGSSNAEEILEKGRQAFLRYDFEEASDLFDQYRNMKTKAKQELPENFEELETKLEIAANAFDRVQKIEVIDSISMPRSTFVQSYRLSRSAGKIGYLEELEIKELTGEPELAFLSERGDYLINVTSDPEGYLRLRENNRLLDGSWESRETLTGDFEQSGNYLYPFMSSDGQTLYFANDGEESIGGLDIFVAQKEPISGEFLQPLNLGMPFNSPYDDFMMAIDEENGIGWWATDRNSPEGNVTIYVYLIDDIRKNYPSDTENLVDLALLEGYKSTWEEDNLENYKSKLSTLPEVKKNQENKNEEFILPLGNGKVYYKFTDFKNRKASDLMKQYLLKEKELIKKEDALSQYRQDYKTNKSLQNKIQSLEEEVLDLKSGLNSIRTEILRLEKTGK